MELQNFWLIFAIATLGTLVIVNAQNFPPRLNIPGAVPVPVRQQQQQHHQQPQVVRVRRPIAAQVRPQNPAPLSVTSRLLDEAKPVTESGEEEQPDVFLPQLLRDQQLANAQQVQFQQAAAAFLQHGNAADQNTLQDSSPLNGLDSPPPSTILPAPTRPAPVSTINTPAATINRPSNFNDFGIGRFETQRFGLERPQAPPARQQPQQEPQRVLTSRPRPQQRPESRIQYADPQDLPAPPPVRPRPKPVQPRPIIHQNQLQQDDRDEQQQQQQQRRRPVAQTTRKWREEMDDGSIVWGYENDDGSFKEELIGTDCVTKGTYGYIDPDGNKREYHYETGIKCDPITRETEEETAENGFINYENNRAVLPNGIEIDMSQLGKKKSKRPGAGGGGGGNIYRN